jgi:small subunit ribosomal protein S6
MRVYETTFILSPQADEATFDRQITAVADIINRNNGKILRQDRWGIRRLAYPIRKFNQGFYTRFIYEGSNDILTEMDRHFRLEEQFLRNLTVIYEGEMGDKIGEEPMMERSEESDGRDRDRDRDGGGGRFGRRRYERHTGAYASEDEPPASRKEGL